MDDGRLSEHQDKLATLLFQFNLRSHFSLFINASVNLFLGVYVDFFKECVQCNGVIFSNGSACSNRAQYSTVIFRHWVRIPILSRLLTINKDCEVKVLSDRTQVTHSIITSTLLNRYSDSSCIRKSPSPSIDRKSSTRAGIQSGDQFRPPTC